MINRIAFWTLLVLFCFHSHHSHSQNYIFFKTHSMDIGSSTRIFVALYGEPSSKPLQAKDVVSKYLASCKIYQEYNLSGTLLHKIDVPLSISTTYEKDGQVIFGFDIPKYKHPKVIISLELRHKHNGHQYKTFFEVFKKERFRYKYALYRQGDHFPLFSNFVRQGESFTVKDHLGTRQKLYFTKMAYDFGPAKAPMDLRKIKNGSMNVDSSFVLESNKMINQLPLGLYLVRSNPDDFYGIGFRVVPDDYPHFGQLEELIPPLTYISTKEEMKQLYNAPNPKQQLDRYWLKLLNVNIPLAQHIIKEYYQNISLSNAYFSTFKEGWKTDRGMVMAVFGYPSTIQHGDDIIQWTYVNQKNIKNTITFTFRRRPNQFTDSYYVLDRYIEYEPLWFPIIEHWRNGSIQNK